MALKLYHMPGACSRVTMNALEELGLDFEEQALNLAKGEHKSAEYLSVNPHGKIPALLVDDALLTENAAILLYLHHQHPDGGLFPVQSDPVKTAQQTADLIWCTSTLHPMVRSIRMPMRFTDGDEAPVKARGVAMMETVAAMLQARIGDGQYWYGDQWSIVDVYLYWNYDTARSGGFDFSPYPGILAHGERVRARPSFQRALKREQEAMEANGIILPPGAEL